MPPACPFLTKCKGSGVCMDIASLHISWICDFFVLIKKKHSLVFHMLATLPIVSSSLKPSYRREMLPSFYMGRNEFPKKLLCVRPGPDSRLCVPHTVALLKKLKTLKTSLKIFHDFFQKFVDSQECPEDGWWVPDCSCN